MAEGDAGRPVSGQCGYGWSGQWGVDLEEPGVVSRPRKVAHFCVKDHGHIGRHGCHCGAKSSSGIGAPEPRVGLLCSWQPVPDPMHVIPTECPMCGHMTMAHVGERECPVCVLVWHGTEQYARQQARQHGRSWPS